MSESKMMTVRFVASGRGKAQCAPDPAYPHGIEVKLPSNVQTCTARLPYPAPECGHFLVKCLICASSLALTAAGRPDDPVSVTVPCNIIEAERPS